MVMQRTDRLSWLLALALVMPAVSCGSQGSEQVPTYILFGTVTSTTVNTSGKVVYIWLTGEDGTMSDPALYLTDCRFEGPVCDYKFLRIREGQYNMFALVDLNGNAAMDNPRPDSGDLVSVAIPILMWARLQKDLPDNIWRPVP
jgi:hypothetical protein